MPKEPTEVQKKKAILRDIINECPIYQPSPYEGDENIWFGTNVEGGYRIELQLTRSRFKLLRGLKVIKSNSLKEVNPRKFKEYIYSVVGVKPPEEPK